MKNLGRYENDLSIPRKKDVDEKYTKPEGGIPKADLSSSVQESLGKADTALQSAPVTSVNGKEGAVTLTQDDVKDGTTYVQYSKEEKTKLSGVEEGATKNTITLNGEANQNPEFYAPTTFGEDDQILVGTGEGSKPMWMHIEELPIAKRNTILNPEIEAVDGVFTWDIPYEEHMANGECPVVQIYKYLTEDDNYRYTVLADVGFGIEGGIRIKIKDVDESGTLPADTYIATIIG